MINKVCQKLELAENQASMFTDLMFAVFVTGMFNLFLNSHVNFVPAFTERDCVIMIRDHGIDVTADYRCSYCSLLLLPLTMILCHIR